MGDRKNRRSVLGSGRGTETLRKITGVCQEKGKQAEAAKQCPKSDCTIRNSSVGTGKNLPRERSAPERVILASIENVTGGEELKSELEVQTGCTPCF